MDDGLMTRRAFAPRLAGGFAAACVIALPAAAQEAKPWKLEDAIGAPDWLTISGSLRARYERLDPPYAAGRSGPDDALLTQGVLELEAKAGDFRFVGEVYDARVLAENGGGGAASGVDALEISQLFIAWRPEGVFAAGDKLDVMAGRFTVDFGSRRLIARSNFGNTLQQFEGVRGWWQSAGGVKLDGFYTTPLSRRPSDAASALDNEIEDNLTPDDVRLWGALVSAPVKAFPGGEATAEAFMIGLDEEDEAALPSRNRNFDTWGVRLRRAPKSGVFDFDVEGVRQTGTSRATTSNADVTDLDHDASMFHAEAGYTFDAPWKPRLSVLYDFASGDETPGDLSNERFDALFGDRAFELGPTSLFNFVQRTNLSSPGVRIEAAPDKKQDVLALVRQVTLDEKRDSFGTSNVRDATGASGDDVGTMIELRYRRWLVQDAVRLQIGGAYVFQGEFLETAPNAVGEGDPAYGYAMVSWTF
jgi:hypothetical protein